MTANLVVVREDSGKLVEQANFVGGKWTVFWTSTASKALLLTSDKAEEIVQALSEDGLHVSALAATEFLQG